MIFYLNTAREKDLLVKIVERTERRKINGIMSYYKGEKKVSTNEINETHLEKLHTMNLHGEYFKQQLEIPNVNIELSNKWLTKSYLRSETESLICAAQEQTLATNYLSTKI